MASGSSTGVTSSLGRLQINSSARPNSKTAQPAESWEDEADSSSDTETERVSTPQRPGTSDLPGPPPPTPSSPTFSRTSDVQFAAMNFDGAFDNTTASRSSNTSEERRPDKTTSVASRMIAAGIGQKAPKRTQEQREYDQAMKIQEKKKREQAKEEEERKKREKARAQAAIWDD